jgi:hypothetical protein
VVGFYFFYKLKKPVRDTPPITRSRASVGNLQKNSGTLAASSFRDEKAIVNDLS